MEPLDRRSYLQVLAAGMPLFFAPHAFAQHETLVDYLNCTGRDASFEARNKLWGDYRPADKYTGSEEQNIAFLRDIKVFDQSPRIELVRDVLAVGDEVTVVAKAGNAAPLGIETGLALQSLSVPAGQEQVSLGRAAAGVFSIRVTDGTHDRRYQLFLLPTANGLVAELYGAAAKSLPPNTPAIYQPESTVAEALNKLYRSLTAEAIQIALQEATPSWVAQNVVSFGETMIVCAIGGPVPCLVAGGAHGWSAMSAILTKLASNSPALNEQEKQLLGTVFAVGDTAVQFIASFSGPAQRRRLCELAGPGLTLADSVAGQIETEQMQLTLKVILQSTKKFTTVLCGKDI